MQSSWWGLNPEVMVLMTVLGFLLKCTRQQFSALNSHCH